MGDPQTIIIQGCALMLAVTFHEAAHGWVAFKNGDPTAKLAGRITLNPIPHVDLFGTIIFPALLILMQAPILIGWAKPVPVNPMRFRNPKKGFALVSVAGPASNLLLAGIAAIIIKTWMFFDPKVLAYIVSFFQGEAVTGVRVTQPLAVFLWILVQINVVLGVFNLFPIPPLDGGHFLMGILPPKQSMALAQIERFGMMIVLLLVYVGVLDFFVRPISHFFIRLFLW